MLRLAAMAKQKRQKSKAGKRSVVLGDHKTSISLEDGFWTALREIAARQNIRISELVMAINRYREYGNLSSAVRVYVLDYYQQLSMKQHG
jgi:predicted DNA-binding ribbon-helix-helix protein